MSVPSTVERSPRGYATISGVGRRSEGAMITGLAASNTASCATHRLRFLCADVDEHEARRARDPVPIASGGGEPGYFGYAGNNPLSNVDPSGLVYCYSYGADSNGLPCDWSGECTAAPGGHGFDANNRPCSPMAT